MRNLIINNHHSKNHPGFQNHPRILVRFQNQSSIPSVSVEIEWVVVLDLVVDVHADLYSVALHIEVSYYVQG